MKLKILFDFQILRHQYFGGISKYFYEIFNIIKNTQNARIVALFNINLYFNNYIKSYFFKLNSKLNIGTYFLNKLYTRIYIKYFKPDIIHATYYDDYIFNIKGKHKIISTIHDMIDEIYFNNNKFIETERYNKRKHIEKSDRIIAVSESTKKEILKFYPNYAKKIDVIYSGCPIVINTERVELPEKYLLYVGSRSTYKNFNFFIKSISSILLESENLFLVCVYKYKFNKDEIELLNKLNIFNKVKLMYLNDNQLYFSYQNAICFVFPSLMEGFGLPILEAFKNRCPVVCSEIEVFKEIAIDASEYFDPKDELSISETIKKVINNEKLRENMIKKGDERVKYFSWEKCANETVNTYYKALNNE